jgi:transposase
MTKQFKELTDSQWEAISPFLNLNRKRKLNLRFVLNAIFYLLRTSCIPSGSYQWRNLPSCFPSWRAVNYYFEKWKKDGTFEKMNTALNSRDRLREEREAYPSLICIDSQSVKLSPMIFENRGLDAYKKVNGRKRHLNGYLMGLLIHLVVYGQYG